MTSKFATAAAAVTAALFLAMSPPANAGDSGAAIGAGIAGFAAGTFLGGALASHPHDYGPDYYAYEPDPDDYGPSVRWCMRHYRSYDLRSRTYLGYDGHRHPCP